MKKPRGPARTTKNRKVPKGGSSTAPAKPHINVEPNLRLEWRTPAELSENPRNWREHPREQISALTAAMAEVGWAGALLYNEATGRIIDGHARRKVALEQGAEKVPVLVGSWDEETEKKILLTLDPIGAMAGAGKEQLDSLLREVQTSNEDLAGMLTELAQANGISPADSDPSKLGSRRRNAATITCPECGHEFAT